MKSFLMMVYSILNYKYVTDFYFEIIVKFKIVLCDCDLRQFFYSI